jgi:hypothetical protein
MRAKLLAVAVTTLAVFGVSACFPTFLTSRPEAEIIVTDEAGAPLEGATVTLGTTEWHGIVGRISTQDFITDREGRVEIDDDHEWKVQIMLPDGDVRYAWSLCIAKPGYEAFPKPWADFDQPIQVAMYPSAVNSVCEWPAFNEGPRVKEREARWIEVEGGEWPTHRGFQMMLDESIRPAMEASAREQGITLRSWSEYRFQYQARGTGLRDTRLLVHALCRAPAEFDLTKAFYSEPDEGACFFETMYTSQSYTDQPKSSFGPLKIVSGKG